MQDYSERRGFPYKRTHLVALRTTKITASDPPSTGGRASDEETQSLSSSIDFSQ